MRSLEIIDGQNFQKYQQWHTKAMADPLVRRFISIGWTAAPKAPENDWERLILCSDTACVTLSFSRGDESEISIGIWALECSRIAAGRALVALAEILPRYAYFRRVVSRVMETNHKAMQLNRQLLGNPWGIDPECAWDEHLCRHVAVAHFSRPMQYVMKVISSKSQP